jgi:hypothetical protein
LKDAGSFVFSRRRFARRGRLGGGYFPGVARPQRSGQVAGAIEEPSAWISEARLRRQAEPAWHAAHSDAEVSGGWCELAWRCRGVGGAYDSLAAGLTTPGR